MLKYLLINASLLGFCLSVFAQSPPTNPARPWAQTPLSLSTYVQPPPASVSSTAEAAPPTAGANAKDTTGSTRKIEFAKVRTQIQTGDPIGHVQGGWLCLGNRVLKASDQLEMVFTNQAAFAFRRVAGAYGVAVASREVTAFDTAAPSDAEYRLGGVVSALDINTCSYPNGRKGTLHVEVRWDLFSTHQQRVVLSKAVVGDYKLDAFEDVPGRDFEARVFESALNALFTDPDVKTLLNGDAPALPAAAAFPLLRLKSAAVMSGTTVQNVEALRSAVVTISSDKGMGSGFYIADGYVLTGKHVVGTSRFVKVVLMSGQELVGEVIREDGPLDVALLKTASSGSPVIHPRLTDPAVGEDVYAIGSPLMKQLAGTFTRGVLSGIRETDGIRLLQSDVAINPGNSGGPLLDASGNAIGFTAAKITGASGLAFFVPIRDAANRLSLVFDVPTTR